MSNSALSQRSPAAGILLVLALLPVGLAVGFFSGPNLIAAVGLTGALGAMILLLVIPFSFGLKLFVLMTAIYYLQQVSGFFSSQETRGLSVGNLLLATLFGYWVVTSLRRGTFHKPTPIDAWLLLVAVLIPLSSILYTATFRKVPGYSLWPIILFYKKWLTPFACFFFLCQIIEKKSELRILFLCVLALTGIGVLAGAPEMAKFSAWKGQGTEARSTGILDQANAYAGLIALMAPYFFLTLFLVRGRPVAQAGCLLLLGCFALSLVTTYSRAGYIAFGVALLGTIYVSYRGGGRIPFVGPALILGSVAVVAVCVAPQMIESVQKRFDIAAYKHSMRRSTSKYATLNQFTGDRLELWSAALQMAKEEPIFGVGYRAFPTLLPKYHRKGVTNTTHNQYLGALAEGGIVWLAALLAFYWQLLKLLHRGWRRCLERGDLYGQICCGGALVSFVVMLGLGMTGDFLHPDTRGFVFWLLVAGAFKYGLLTLEEEKAEPHVALASAA